MDTFLTPIEKPEGIVMKLVYFLTRKRFGKVLMPLKVHSARLPSAFGIFYGKISQLDKKLGLSPELTSIIRQQVSRLNLCLFCSDAGKFVAMQAELSENKFNALDTYAISLYFTDAERAALDYATELTLNKNVKQTTFKKMSTHFSEREICEIVWLVASEHLYNVTNLGLNIHSDMLCELDNKKVKS